MHPVGYEEYHLFRILDKKQTVTVDVYSEKLQQWHEVLLETRPDLVNQKDVIVQHDTGTPYVAKFTQQRVEQVGWEVLPHPP